MDATLSRNLSKTGVARKLHRRTGARPRDPDALAQGSSHEKGGTSNLLILVQVI
jgi:hypothetical protein